MNRATHILIFSGLLMTLPASAPAYVGPTLGLGIVGTVIALDLVVRDMGARALGPEKGEGISIS